MTMKHRLVISRSRLALARKSQSGVSAELAEDSVTSGKESKAHSGEERVGLNRDIVLPRGLGLSSRHKNTGRDHFCFCIYRPDGKKIEKSAFTRRRRRYERKRRKKKKKREERWLGKKYKKIRTEQTKKKKTGKSKVVDSKNK